MDCTEVTRRWQEIDLKSKKGWLLNFCFGFNLKCHVAASCARAAHGAGAQQRARCWAGMFAPRLLLCAHSQSVAGLWERGAEPWGSSGVFDPYGNTTLEF